MEESDRESIEVNLSKLVRATNYDRLMECCLERGILFDVMRDKIERINDTKAKCHRALFLKIMKRGPTAFEALLQLLRSEFPDAVHILRNEVSLNRGAQWRRQANSSTTTQQQRIPDSDTMRPGYAANSLAEFTDPSLPPATAFTAVQPSRQFHGNANANDIQCYSMQSRNRGVAFLVNIINFRNRPKEPRHGADVDKVNLVQLFRQMGFTVMYYENRTAGELRTLLGKLQNSRWLRSTDCFVMALMTHGTMVNEVAKVEFYDNSFLDLNEVLGFFSNRNSAALLHKPKVFLFPFCRGTTLEQPVNVERKSGNDSDGARVASDAAKNFGGDDAEGQDNVTNNNHNDSSRTGGGDVVGNRSTGSQLIPTYSDMKICYATGPGFEAMREPDTGSWYIESMCRIWATHAHDKSLDDLLKMVGENQLNKQSELGHIQTAHNEDRGFFKKLYFNPGYYGD